MQFLAWATAILLGIPLYGGLPADAQNSAPATPAPYNPLGVAEITGTPRAAVQAGQSNSRFESQNAYFGGVPAGTISPTPVDLSLEDAVNRALRQNLGSVLATDAVTDAQGRKWQALSDLLPDLVTDTRFGVHQIDTREVIGLIIPGHASIIGPFGYFDSRAYLKQSVFDWESIERARSSQEQLKSAELRPKMLASLLFWSLCRTTCWP